MQGLGRAQATEVLSCLPVDSAGEESVQEPSRRLLIDPDGREYLDDVETTATATPVPGPVRLGQRVIR